MSCEVTFMPIGHVTGGRKEATKDGWGNNRSRIELDGARFKPDALLGIEELSHIEVIFYFHVHADEPTEVGAARLSVLREHVELFPRHAALKRVAAWKGVPLRPDVRPPMRDLDAMEVAALESWLRAELGAPVA